MIAYVRRHVYMIANNGGQQSESAPGDGRKSKVGYNFPIARLSLDITYPDFIYLTDDNDIDSGN